MSESSAPDLKLLCTTYNDMEAEVVTSRLEVEGIQTYKREEGAGDVLGINVGLLGEIDIFVKVEDYEAALDILELEPPEEPEA
jgi:hypothetical protein